MAPFVVHASAVRAPRREAEATRKRLQELGVLRIDLEVAKDSDDILFPVADSCGPTLPTESWDFTARAVRTRSYTELLDWPPELLDLAPRAFEQLGDIVVVKVPKELAEDPRPAQLGDALLRFHAARAVFHDKGVKGEFRTRDLVRIAGTGDSLTRVAENGVSLWVDLSRAYFSPRLATERHRVAALVRPGEHLVDLFGGVAPQGIQAARKGAAVDTIDLNPDAMPLAQRNVRDAGVEALPGRPPLAGQVAVHLGDARAVAARLAPADRVTMNLPHGAKHFLDVAASVLKPGGTLHYHEILAPQDVATRAAAVIAELKGHDWECRLSGTRVVRNYSPSEAHVVFDFVGTA